MQLFSTASYLNAHHYQQVLSQRGVEIDVCEVEQLNARFLDSILIWHFV
jgi:16S rRNA (guanine1516-N2)-methyltransferase